MTALVTGAGGAIGAAIVQQLLTEGQRVIAQDIRAESLTQFRETNVSTVVGDLLNSECADQLGRAIIEQPIDRVIAAHGIDGSGALAGTDQNFVRRVMAINAATIPALLAITRKSLSASGGVLMIVDSQAGLLAERDNVAYCASKFAVVGWARIMRPILADEGIALRLFCPGCTETPLLFAAQERFAAAQGLQADDFLRRRRAHIPIQRFARVEQTAAGACYLATPGIHTPFVLAATGGEVLY